MCILLLTFAACNAGEIGAGAAQTVVPAVSDTGGAAATDTGEVTDVVSAAPTPADVFVPSAGTEPPPDAEASVSPADVMSFATATSLIEETPDMGEAYLNRITFLGDSLTYGLKVYGMLSGGKNTEQVWTPANGTFTLANQSFFTVVYPTTGEEIPVRTAVERAQPDILIINLGVNGVSFMDEEYFKKEYVSLIKDVRSLSPNTKIILQSILPVAENYKAKKSINNEKITAANGWILEIAAENGLRYLDTNSALSGDDGWLPRKYESGDGMHLTPAGYRAELENIRTHAITN
jgi:lysophospholipase L1-like esterase